MRGWVEYFRLADMKGLLKTRTNGQGVGFEQSIGNNGRKLKQISNAESIGNGTLESKRNLLVVEKDTGGWLRC